MKQKIMHNYSEIRKAESIVKSQSIYIKVWLFYEFIKKPYSLLLEINDKTPSTQRAINLEFKNYKLAKKYCTFRQIPENTDSDDLNLPKFKLLIRSPY